MQNKAFSGELDKWALLGRSPKALNPEPSPGGGYDAEWAMLRKARIAKLFRLAGDLDNNDDQVILDFVTAGQMSDQTCKILVRGERLFREMIFKETYNL